MSPVMGFKLILRTVSQKPWSLNGKGLPDSDICDKLFQTTAPPKTPSSTNELQIQEINWHPTKERPTG